MGGKKSGFVQLKIERIYIVLFLRLFLFLCKFFKLMFFVGVQKNAEVTSGIDIAYSGAFWMRMK